MNYHFGIPPAWIFNENCCCKKSSKTFFIPACSKHGWQTMQAPRASHRPSCDFYKINQHMYIYVQCTRQNEHIIKTCETPKKQSKKYLINLKPQTHCLRLPG